MKKAIIKIMSLYLVCVLLTSCAGNAPSYGGNTGHGTDKGEPPERITPADFYEGDISYTLEISDGKRTVVLDVSRKSSVTEAKIIVPERLSGVSVISDESGVRLIPANGELLGLTGEGAAGIRTFFDVMGRQLTDADKKEEGMYRFELGGYETVVLLSSDGLPRLISLSRAGYTRHGEVRFEDAGQ